MNLSQKVINTGTIIIKCIDFVLFLLALIFPWSNLTLNRFNPFGQMIIIIIYVLFIIGVSLTLIGILDVNLSEILEEVGIFWALITVGFYTFYLIGTMFFYPSKTIMFNLGYIFALITVIIPLIEFYGLRNKFNELFKKQPDTDKEGGKARKEDDSEGFFSKLGKKISSSETTKKVAKTASKQVAKKAGEMAGDVAGEQMKELTDDEQLADFTEKAVKMGVKEAGERGFERLAEYSQERKRSERETERKKRSSYTRSAYFINIFSILFKIFGLIIGILSIIFPWSTLDLSQYNELGQLVVLIFFIVYIFGFLISFLGIFKNELARIFEELGLIIAIGSLGIFFIFTIFLMIGYPSNNINFELGYYLALITVMIISMDIFVFREYFSKSLKERKRQKGKGRLMSFSDRIKTKADFPERWALIHGEKPKEEEDFIHFKEVELNKSLSKVHPNYLHLKMKNLLERLGYRIIKSQRPLSTKEYDFDFYDLNGMIKASIRTEIEGRTKIGNIYGLIFGSFFLFNSLILILLNFLARIHSFGLLMVAAYILIPISMVFILEFIIRYIRQGFPDVVGYTNIYVLEQGNAWYGREYSHDEEENRNKAFESPSLGFDEVISLGMAVKSMSVKKAENDLGKLYNKINEF